MIEDKLNTKSLNRVTKLLFQTPFFQYLKNSSMHFVII